VVALTRINNNIAALTATRTLQSTSRDLSTSLERLSSGLRINRASDDAAGLAVAENLRTQINGLNQAIDSAAGAINLVNTAEGALIETTARLQRIRALAVQAGNTGTNDPSALDAIQAEIAVSIEEIIRIAETTQFASRLLLNGDNENSVNIVGGTTLGVTPSPAPNVSTLSTGTHYLAITQTNPGSVTLSAGSDGNNNTGATAFVGSTFDSGMYDLTLTNVRAAAKREVAIGFTIEQNGSTPASGDNLIALPYPATFTNDAGDTFTIGTSDVIRFIGTESNGTAFDITFTIAGGGVSVAGLQTALRAALTDTVSWDASSGQFVVTAATTGETPLTMRMQIDDNGGGDSQEFYAGNVVRVAGNLNDGVLSIDGGPAVQVQAGGTYTLEGRPASDSSQPPPQITMTMGAALTEGSDLLTIVAAQYEANLNGGRTVTFQNGDRDVLFRTGGTTRGLPSGENVSLDFGSVVDLGGATERTLVLSAVNNSLSFQIGANGGQDVQFGLANLGAGRLGFASETQPNGRARLVSEIDVTTLTGVEEALRILDEAIDQVNQQRSSMGAFTNRLDAAISNMGVAMENLTASESRIRDADFALETTRFTRDQILIQAGVSILTQANSLPQQVLQLLG
jgi:flagellin